LTVTGGRDTAARSHRIAGAAALIAGLTLVSRLAGFARTLVFGKTVGYTQLGDVYQTANLIPNIIFEIVAGGALAALVVPMLAGAVSRGDRRAQGATASALLSWALLILTPLALVVLVAARPITQLLAANASPAELATGTRMLRVFAPQLPLYGVSIVLAGVLQAHRRFAWPVLAPLLSSLTVIMAYVTYGVADPGRDIPEVGAGGELILSAGTTLGVVVLALCLVGPVRRLELPWRPTLRFTGPRRGAVRDLAVVGMITVATQQLTVALAVRLINAARVAGGLVLFTQAQTIYLLPWSVLAVPVATSAYPVLATAFAAGDLRRYDRTLASSTRSVLLLTGLGAGALAGLAWPIAWLFAHLSRTAAVPLPVAVPELAQTIIAFAPGLLGYGLFALHSRALYARADNRYAAAATVTGWGVVALASVATLLTAAAHRLPAIAAANSLGMLALGAVLLVIIGRRAGSGALAGVRRAGTTAVLAGSLSALAGATVRVPLPAARGFLGVTLVGGCGGVAVALVFVGTAVLLDRPDAAPLLSRLRRLVGSGSPDGGRSGGEAVADATGGGRPAPSPGVQDGDGTGGPAGAGGSGDVGSGA
jgi:putative peptidoglycan lipid II flippase